ncbi:MAG: cell division protein FtsQ [Bacteroidaceae bacterium]|nr:cell division protein FtsQ [Bacteroidaceae bacterium]
MKKVLPITFSVLLLAYMVYGIVLSHDGTDMSGVCKGVSLYVRDSLEYGTVSRTMVMDMLKDNGLDPTGKPVGKLYLDSMEHVLCSHPFIRTAECFLTSDARLRIDITSKMPVARVRGSLGQDFYIDEYGSILPCRGVAVNVPVVTGNVNRKTASGTLLELLNIIAADEFWKAQVEQINVTARGQVQLVPRVGAQILELGSMEDFRGKLDRLKHFYDKGLGDIGWNKYSSISVAYKGQVVCKKRK